LMASGMEERRCNDEAWARTQSSDYAPSFKDLPTNAYGLLRAQQKADTPQGAYRPSTDIVVEAGPGPTA